MPWQEKLRDLDVVSGSSDDLEEVQPETVRNAERILSLWDGLVPDPSMIGVTADGLIWCEWERGSVAMDVTVGPAELSVVLMYFPRGDGTIDLPRVDDAEIREIGRKIGSVFRLMQKEGDK